MALIIALSVLAQVVVDPKTGEVFDFAALDTYDDYLTHESDAWEASLDLCPICDGHEPSWRTMGCHLENRGYWDARAEEDYEARMGLMSYEQARDLAAAGA